MGLRSTALGRPGSALRAKKWPCSLGLGCRNAPFSILPRWVAVSLRSFLLFVFGLCATVFLTEVGKISSGVLRPNFIDLCRPNVTCR